MGRIAGMFWLVLEGGLMLLCRLLYARLINWGRWKGSEVGGRYCIFP
jgi:hypothetical protein